MGVNDHTINRELFEFYCSETEHAFRVRNRFSQDLQEKLTGIINTACNEVEVDNMVTIIPKLEIDLGTIHFNKLEEEILSGFQKVFFEKISEYKNGQHWPVKTIVQKRELSFDILNYFLQKGYLPWFAATQGEKYLLSLFEEVFDSEDSIRRLVFLNLDNDSFIERFVLQLNPTYLKRVIVSIGAEIFFVSIKKIIENVIERSISLLKTGSNSLFLIDDNGLLQENQPNEQQLFESALQHLETIQTNVYQQLEKLSLEYLLKSIARKSSFNIQQQIGSLLKKILAEKTGLAETFWQTLSAEYEDNLKELQEMITSIKDQLKENERLKEGMFSEELPAIELKFYISNAGLILIANYLPAFFKELQLLNEGNFIDKNSQLKTVFLLHYLCTGKNEIIEYIVPLNKILSGLQLDEPIPQQLFLSEKEKLECDALLHAIIENWQRIGDITIEGLRESFINRDGILSYEKNQWILKMERRGYDVLLDALPWSFNYIKLNWMQDLIITNGN